MGRRERITIALGGSALLAAVLLVGGAPRWAQGIVAVLAASSLAIAISSRRGFERWPPLLLLLLGAAGWTLVQWLPLPAGLAHALSPTLDALRADGAAVAGVDAATSLSMDRPGSLRGVTFFLTLSSVAVVALRASLSERGRYLVVALVAIVAGAAALATGIHVLLGASSLYGLYTPRTSQPIVLGPLLNTNHLGSLMAIGVAASVGLVLYAKQPSNRRALWVLIALGCTVNALATLSRGAVISVGIGLAVALLSVAVHRMQAIGKRAKRRRARFLTTTVPVAIMVVCALTLAVFIGAGSVVTQLENTSLQELDQPTSKFAAWRSTIRLIEESPWVGVGRGAFEPTFTRVHPASALAVFSHPENEPLQVIVDLGIPFAILLGGVAIWMLSIAVSRWQDGPLAAGALGAVAAVGFQSNFDFGIELLGIAVPVTMLLATLTYVPLSERRGPALPRMRVLRALHAGIVLVGGALLFSDATRGVDDDHHELRENPSRDAALAAIERHPLDYFSYGVLAEQMVREGRKDVIPVLNHALRLHPTHAGLHRLVARLLLRAGKVDQARIEYASALRHSAEPRPILLEVIAVLDAASAVRAIPVELDHQRVTQILDAAARHDLSMKWLQHVVSSSRSPRAVDALYARAVKFEDHHATELALARRCALTPSTRCQLDRARVLTSLGRPREVIAVLHDVPRWIGRTDEKLAAWLLLCDAHAAVADVDEARQCLRHVDVSGLLPTDHPLVKRRREQLDARPPAP